MGGSDDKNNDFKFSGPRHLTQTEVDWNNEEHRRCITASLIKGTYVLEVDNENKRKEVDNENKRKELAPAWWENFHFSLHDELRSMCDCVCCKSRRTILGDQSTTRSFVYGAVFKYEAKNRHQFAPHYVVAFRGTMPRNATVFGDMGLNIKLLIDKHKYCDRFREARTRVTSLLGTTPPADVDTMSSNSVVWLAGHSLGASIALDLGRHNMLVERCNLPTFLFNPPHVSAAPVIHAAMPEDAKRGLYRFSYHVKWLLGTAILSSHTKRMHELFWQLAPWVPNLYVHRSDAICNGFIDYFEQREQVKGFSARVANLAATLSYRDMVSSAFKQQSERQHLLPCAVTWTRTSEQVHSDDPHGLKQWWQPTSVVQDMTRNLYTWPLK